MPEDCAANFRERLAELSTPLPGAIPYDNPRPIFVQHRYEGLTVEQFCNARHPHLGHAYWQAAFDARRISYQGKPAVGCEPVAAGAVLVHTEPNTVEPYVDPRMELVYEDAALVALHKPAPLPAHPCGRFNKNTLTTAQPIHLHSWRLSIRSPATGELLDLEAPPPPWARVSSSTRLAGA